MKTGKRIHGIWNEYQTMKKKHPDTFKELQISANKFGRGTPCPVGKWQYIFSSKKGKISMVYIKDYFRKGDNFYEIYVLEGNLFEDTERYRSRKEAIKVIKRYLK